MTSPRAVTPLPADAVATLRGVMARLRDPATGCPWDRAQSLASLRRYLLEESYELVEAIDALGHASQATSAPAAGPDEAITAHREELGDVLLQVVFQSQLAQEFGWFDLEDVAQGIVDKMVRRHPHVFASDHPEEALTPEQVVDQWQAIKAEEKARPRETFAGVNDASSALMRAQQTGKAAARRAFDWPDVVGALGKVDEERRELEEAITSGDSAAIEHELGDMLLALTSVARHTGVDAEVALSGALTRFRRRFQAVERGLDEQPDADIQTMERWWREAKGEESERR